MTLYDNVTRYDNFPGECFRMCVFCTMVNVWGSMGVILKSLDAVQADENMNMNKNLSTSDSGGTAMRIALSGLYAILLQIAILAKNCTESEKNETQERMPPSGDGAFEAKPKAHYCHHSGSQWSSHSRRYSQCCWFICCIRALVAFLPGGCSNVLALYGLSVRTGCTALVLLVSVQQRADVGSKTFFR